jgi:hypothetical protein
MFRKKRPKFNFPTGINISHSSEMPMPKLLKCLNIVVSFLKEHINNQCLYTYDDWLQHDGLFFDGKSIQFEEIDEMLKTSKSLRKRTSKDFMVYLGIAPEDMSWYLRIYTEEIDVEGDNGYFDIGISKELVDKLLKELKSKLDYKFILRESPEYYEEIKENG